MSSERLKMIDLFSGAGGLSEGLSEAGFHSLFASEIVPFVKSKCTKKQKYFL